VIFEYVFSFYRKIGLWPKSSNILISFQKKDVERWLTVVGTC